MKKRLCSILGVCLVAAFSHADLITAISNLDTVSGSANVSYGNSSLVAVEFHTSSTVPADAWTEFRLTFKNSTDSYPQANGTIQLWWKKSDTGAPGGLNHSWNMPGGSVPGDGIVSVDVTSGYTMNKNYDYFFVLGANSSFGTAKYTSDLSTPDSDLGPSSGWTMGTSIWRSTDGGDSWTETAHERLQISVAVIPEPAVASLIAFAGGGLIVGHRISARAKKKKAELS